MPLPTPICYSTHIFRNKKGEKINFHLNIFIIFHFGNSFGLNVGRKCCWGFFLVLFGLDGHGGKHMARAEDCEKGR